MNTIQRYGEPNKFDQSPKGTICEVIKDHVISEVYIQMSKDDELPRWELVSH